MKFCSIQEPDIPYFVTMVERSPNLRNRVCYDDQWVYLMEEEMITWIDDKEQCRYFITSLNDKWLVASCPFNQALTAMTIYDTFPTHDDAVTWVREKILLEEGETNG